MELDEFKVECDTSMYKYHHSLKGGMEAERAIPKEWFESEATSRIPTYNACYWVYAKDGSFSGVHKVFVMSKDLESVGSPQGLGYVEINPALLNTHNRLQVSQGINHLGHNCQTVRCCFDADVVLRIGMLNEKLMRVHKPPEKFTLQLPELKASYPPRVASGETIEKNGKRYTHLRPYGALADHSQMIMLWQDEDGYMRGWEKIDGLPLGRKRYASCVDQTLFVENGEKSYTDSFLDKIHPSFLKRLARATMDIEALNL